MTVASPKRTSPSVSRSMSAASTMRYSLMTLVRAKIASVTGSGAGPPLRPLNLMPKSPSGPPGLWLADRTTPPIAPYLRITQEAAGVESRPPRPTRMREKPLAAAIFTVVCTTSRLRKRPSPPTTSVVPARSGRQSTIAWTKFST